jgi:hypothetical protein
VKRIRRLPVDQLRPHETTDQQLLEQLIRKMQQGYMFHEPIVVDGATGVILDGHHRHAACKKLGIERIRCIVVDYRSPQIRVESRRPGLLVSKEDVIRRGLSGDLYPPKTTRHVFDGLGKDAMGPS